jgi:hypothetical protein
MQTALKDLELSRLLVVYPGSLPYPLTERVQVVPLNGLEAALNSIL